LNPRDVAKACVYKSRFTLICKALGYDLDGVQILFETTYEVRPPVNSSSTFIFEMFIPESLKANADPRTAQLQTSSHRAAVQLCRLLYALGGSEVGEWVFLEGSTPQRRWNTDGSFLEVTLVDSGIGQLLGGVFSDHRTLEQTLDSCVQSDWIIRNAEGTSQTYSLSNEMYSQISSDPREDIILIGLIFIIHIYPRDEELHKS
jgi:hypothetical protein